MSRPAASKRIVRRLKQLPRLLAGKSHNAASLAQDGNASRQTSFRKTRHDPLGGYPAPVHSRTGAVFLFSRPRSAGVPNFTAEKALPRRGAKLRQAQPVQLHWPSAGCSLGQGNSCSQGLETLRWAGLICDSPRPPGLGPRRFFAR